MKLPQQRQGRSAALPVWATLAAMIGVAVAALVGFALVLVRTRTGSLYDHDAEWALGGPPWLFYNIEAQLQQISVTTVAVIGAVLAGIASVRRRLGLAAGILVLIGGATVSTQILKNYVIRGLPENLPNSMPSGHATVGISLSLAALMVLPVAWQRFVLPVCAAIGFFFGAGTVIGHWHHPGDVLAALAVCLAWAAAGLAVAQLVGSRTTRGSQQVTTQSQGPGSSATRWLVLAGVAFVCLLFLAWGAQPSRYVLRDVVLGMTAVAAIAVCTLVVYTWVARVTQRIAR